MVEKADDMVARGYADPRICAEDHVWRYVFKANPEYDDLLDMWSECKVCREVRLTRLMPKGSMP